MSCLHASAPIVALLTLSTLLTVPGPGTGAPDDASDQGPRVVVYGLEDGDRVNGGHRTKAFASVEDASAEDWGWEFYWYDGKALVGDGPELLWRPRQGDWVDLKVVAVSHRGTELNASVRVNVSFPGSPRRPEELPTVLASMALVGTAIALVQLHVHGNRER